jgi:hypothetical protein
MSGEHLEDEECYRFNVFNPLTFTTFHVASHGRHLSYRQQLWLEGSVRRRVSHNILKAT